ncbi:PilW family protein [Dyella dinghuensis]|uniref:PilW family protein n=1 Tax=Dyella dinghuensis TaxID=1920169 RepID=UPI002277FD01|nr:PilW family protein [Dyella dinghuensis]
MIAACLACRQRGLSLIELMMAMVLGTLVSAGIVAVFVSTSHSYQAQTQLARLQEEGRFAITQIKDDLAMAGSQYCNNTGGDAHATASGFYQDGLRQPTVYVSDPSMLMNALNDLTTRWGAPYPRAPEEPYSFPSFLTMRGYDCTSKSCAPIDPSNKQSAEGFGIPAMGTKIDNRVIGASVITVRYLNPSAGWTIMPESAGLGSTRVANADGSFAIRLVPMSGEPAIKDFQSGDPLAVVADCSSAQIFAVSGQASNEISSTGNNFAQPTTLENMVAPKLFDFSRDFRTVTYYLKVVDSGDGQGHTTGALVRRVNGGNTAVRGGSSEEIARGIERLDFKYGVQFADGSVRYYSAAQVDASTGADCGSTVSLPIRGSDDKGCLWGSIRVIEIDMLIDGQQPLNSLTQDELSYTYATDDASNGALTPRAPIDAGRKVTPLQQGFPLSMLRREITAVVALRNFNP